MLPTTRLVPGWRLLVLGLPVVLAASALAAAWLFLPEHAAAASVPASDAEVAVPAVPAVPGLLVDVTGAVLHPGLYRLARGDRVYAAIAAAGGLSADADRARLPDLAGALRDGEQVRVPAVHSASRSSRPPPLDLNGASAEQLATVPGFTAELAAAAVAYRTHFGAFESVRELVTELGMGEAEFAAARRYLRT